MDSPPTNRVYLQTMIPPAPQQSNLPASHVPNTSTQDPSPSSAIPKPHRKPLLRLELRDLSSSGTRSFLRLLHASKTLEDAVSTVLVQLYTNLPTHSIPPTRSVTLILRDMGGVAYTTGLDIDSDHKEIHFSTNYIQSIPEARLSEEMRGVIVHEMVHCWQWDAHGTAPGGLIEGIADWVRLKAGLGPPHWRRHAEGNWDAGYERTGYFLEWLERGHGGDVVRRINEALRKEKYDEDAFWQGCCGKSVKELWRSYGRSLKHEEGEEESAGHGAEGCE